MEFAERHKLVIANTLFKHQRLRMVTWHAPNGQSYQIDSTMASNKLKSCVQLQMKGTRTLPRADVGSDHDLMMMTIKVKLPKKCKEEAVCIKYDVEKLKDPNIAEQFKAQIGGKFARHYYW